MKANVKSWLRQISSMDYREVSIPDEYLDEEEKYRKLREVSKRFKDNLDWQIFYEHGGRGYKSMMDAIEVMNNTVSSKKFVINNIFQQLAVCSSELGKLEINSEVTALCKILEDAMNEMSAKKHEINGKLRNAKVSLEKIVNDTKVIDDMRNEMKNARYDLEKKLQAGASRDDPNIKQEEENFKTLFSSTHESMKGFLSGKELKDVLETIINSQKEFYSSGARFFN
ncbi:spore wall protein 12-like [Nylanderia fulva]|uniref:spore wall protein 12-like n=1 Tax=Nylanderia fulva TaxID=613905 RepID=UPI0010FAD37E|nr:spore wall protein 12-like [Nylanderia fulva]